MRIIHVITSFGVGGAEKLLLDIVNRQVEYNEVYIVYLKKIEILIPFLDLRVNTKHIDLSVNVLRELKKFYSEVKPDIIHTHVGHADLLGIWSARNTNSKIFCTMHNIYFKKNVLDNIFFKIYNFLFNRIGNKVNVISISKSVEKHVLEKLKVPSKRSFLIYNAIAPNDYLCNQNKLKKNELDKNGISLLFVGRLVKQKAVHVLLNAMKIIKDANHKYLIKLQIVGDGGLRDELEKMAKELGIDEIVSFEGETTNVSQYYPTVDIFVLPSIWEGFGMVILEAFRAKLAVIASDIEGPSELITDNVNGLLFPVGDHNMLAKKILLLIQNNRLREQLAENGHLLFNEKYHINHYVDQLNKIYEN